MTIRAAPIVAAALASLHSPSTNEPTIAGDCMLLHLLARRAAPDRTLNMVTKDGGAPLGARPEWTGGSATCDVVRAGSPNGLDSDAQVVPADSEDVAWVDVGQSPSRIAFWSVGGAR